MTGRSWRWVISIALSLGVLVLAYVERERIIIAFASLRTANLSWIAAAIVLSFASFFCTSLIYDVALRSLGYRKFGMLRIYAVTIVALILSQSIPAGGVASYAFLTQAMRRRGVPPGHSAVLASLEAITYVIAMLIMFGFGVSYLAIRTGIGAAESTSLVAVAVPIMLVGGALFVITRPQPTLLRWGLAIKRWFVRLIRRPVSDESVFRLVDDIARGRDLVMERPWVLVAMVAVELLSLIGHSFVLLFVIYSLGGTASPLAVIASFGIMMVTSTFNVLPGGGGTVEAVLALTLQGFGVGDTAIVAAVIFRLINFWMMVPVAGVCYWLLMREPAVPFAHTIGAPESTELRIEN